MTSTVARVLFFLFSIFSIAVNGSIHFYFVPYKLQPMKLTGHGPKVLRMLLYISLLTVVREKKKKKTS